MSLSNRTSLSQCVCEREREKERERETERGREGGRAVGRERERERERSFLDRHKQKVNKIATYT